MMTGLNRVLIAFVLILGTRLYADEVSLDGYEEDLKFLASKIAQHRYHLKQSSEGESRLSNLESGLRECQSSFDKMKELAEDLETKESHLHYLREIELEPRLHAVEQVRTDHNRRVEEYNRRAAALKRMIAEHNSRPHTFAPDDTAGLAAYDREADEGNEKAEALNREYNEEQKQFEKDLDAAVTAHGKAQQEVVEEEKKRDAVVGNLRKEAGNYSSLREDMVTRLQAVEKESEPRAARATASATSQPVGPCGNNHALDQLRIVTAASRAAAKTDKEPAKEYSSSGFDSESMFKPADLPYVAVPDAAVPLEVAPPATRQEETEAVVKGSNTLSVFEQKQEEDISKLDQLYKKRLELKQQGATASPEEWTRVVNDISATQAHLNFVAVAQGLNKGSALIDLTITPKAQKKPPEAPPPPP